jgi:thioester reductase-like protein
MRPCDGKHEVVNAASDDVVRLQAELEKKLILLNHHLKKHTEILDNTVQPFTTKALERLTQPEHLKFDYVESEVAMQTEIKDLKCSITALTSREKERVQSLQVILFCCYAESAWLMEQNARRAS